MSKRKMMVIRDFSTPNQIRFYTTKQD